MKLLLTSDGMTSRKIVDFFISQFDTLKDKKVCLIHTIRDESDWQWMDYYRKELGEIGLKHDEINISEEKDLSSLMEYDVYYVCGGNTFYILDRMRKTGLDKVLISAVKGGKFYIGVSAGSIIAGPDIEAAGIGNADINDVDLIDLTGLGLISYIITPHYSAEEEKNVQEFKEKRKEESVIALTDKQAVFIEDEKVILI
ncbi:MAG: Peptidase [Candidatus Moranbacteria bacterium GW2011_GWE1_35_17]|nr:MAG: Peptidase [Candidatus Moranbacteria bacterium GW2011_GWE1_35_17]KKP81158.1 MAG: Peptidase [Candidatus Moranbacteria bacterium GW2011_GWF1_35_5]KKP85185.1 MAG: Peptidase [Candidatus Moranbacteria bacterium GW2011_GWF2_35_54]